MLDAEMLQSYVVAVNARILYIVIHSTKPSDFRFMDGNCVGSYRICAQCTVHHITDTYQYRQFIHIYYYVRMLSTHGVDRISLEWERDLARETKSTFNSVYL